MIKKVKCLFNSGNGDGSQRSTEILTMEQDGTISTVPLPIPSYAHQLLRINATHAFFVPGIPHVNQSWFVDLRHLRNVRLSRLEIRKFEANSLFLHFIYLKRKVGLWLQDPSLSEQVLLPASSMMNWCWQGGPMVFCSILPKFSIFKPELGARVCPLTTTSLKSDIFITSC